MPGTSWIYYGDELGMTGNWQLNPSGTDFHKDRYYRQPMKWDNLDGDVAHTSYTFEGYQVGWDAINSMDSLVPGANQQLLQEGSMFQLMQTLTGIKHQEPALIRGSYVAITTGNTQVMAFRRTLNNETFNIYINFGTSSASVNATGTIVFASDNATLQSQPSFSVLITRTSS
jgi:glycosidase